MSFPRTLSVFVALMTVAAAYAQPVPTPSRAPSLPVMTPEGKGTIGLICTDLQGRSVTFKKSDQDARVAAAFESCVRDVVGEWEKVIEERNFDVTDVDLNEFLGGYKSYRYEAETMRASQMRRHRR